MSNAIYKHGPRSYRVYVQIQDGTEYVGEYATEDEARAEWVDAQKVYNGNRKRKSDVRLYEPKQVVETQWFEVPAKPRAGRR